MHFRCFEMYWIVWHQHFKHCPPKSVSSYRCKSLPILLPAKLAETPVAAGPECRWPLGKCQAAREDKPWNNQDSIQNTTCAIFFKILGWSSDSGFHGCFCYRVILEFRPLIFPFDLTAVKSTWSWKQPTGQTMLNHQMLMHLHRTPSESPNPASQNQKSHLSKPVVGEGMVGPL